MEIHLELLKTAELMSERMVAGFANLPIAVATLAWWP